MRLKGEIAISTINKDENIKQKLIVYYSDEILHIVSVPGLASHRTFLQGKPFSEMASDLELVEQFKANKVSIKVNFGADKCSVEPA